MTNNISAHKYGGGSVSVSQTRHSSNLKGENHNIGVSVDRSIGGGAGGINDASTALHSVSKAPSHTRGKSLFDGTPLQ
jgi:hypothetical protein